MWKVNKKHYSFLNRVKRRNESGENGLLFPCFSVYFSKVHQNLLNPAGGALTSTPIFVTKWNYFYPQVE